MLAPPLVSCLPLASKILAMFLLDGISPTQVLIFALLQTRNAGDPLKPDSPHQNPPFLASLPS